MGVNKFSDLTKKEFKEKFLCKMPKHEPESEEVMFDDNNAPASIDWR